MQQLLTRRLLEMLVTIFLASFLAFTIMRVLPGDAAEVILTRGADAQVSPEDIEAMREQLGLNKPIIVQYGEWVGGLMRLDGGESLTTGRPVLPYVFDSLAVTLELAVITLVLALAVALPLGALSAIHRGSWLDHLTRISLSTWLAVPTFWIGSILLIVFSRSFGWLPPLRFQTIWEDPGSNLLQLIWPAIIVALNIAAGLGRMVRSSMLEVLHQDYVRTARSKGLRDRTIYVRHAFRNAALPVVALSGLTIVNLIGGLVVAETIFNVPGIGTTFVRSLHQRDYPVIQTILLVFTVNVMIVTTVLDLLYGYFNPAIRKDS